MKNEKLKGEVMKRPIVTFIAFVGLLCAAGHSACAAIDLTAYLRKKGAGNYSVTVSGGNEYNNMAKGAFDGDLTTDSGRALMFHGSSGDPKTPSIELNVAMADKPESGFRVTSFRLYRLNASGTAYLERTTRQFALQASDDGLSWFTLYHTTEPQIWTADTVYRDYDVPSSKQGCYKHYRIQMHLDYSDESTEDVYVVGFQELVLFGEIETVKTWIGANGNVWDSMSVNWANLGNSNLESSWSDGAQANFPAGDSVVSVEGPKQVSGIKFDAYSQHNISGSRLDFFPSARILACGCSSISNDLCNTNFPLSADHVGWFPADGETEERSARVRLWRNRRLCDTVLTGATMFFNNNTYQTTPYFKSYQAEGMTVQFQANANGPVFGFKVLFEQDGNDVYGTIQYVRFSWSKSIGYDFDVTGAGVNIGKVYDGGTVSGHYGLKDIAATGGDNPPPLSIECYADASSDYAGAWLPRSDNEQYSGQAVVCWRNRNVKNLEGIKSGVLIANLSVLTSTSVHCFTNDGTTASAQFQSLILSGGAYARVCSKVEFFQQGADVMARVVYAKYDRANLEPHDFDQVSENYRAVIYDANHQGGYGIKDIEARFSGALTLAGKMDIAGDVMVGEGTHCTLGAQSFTLANSFIGDGTIKFATGNGAQTVLVNGVRTLENVVFGGDLAMSFDSGAELSVESVDFENSASVSISGPAGVRLLRIGKSKCLVREQLARFTVNGARATQDENGWIVPKPGMVVSFR